MELRIGKTAAAAGLFFGVGAGLVFGSHTKAGTIQLIDARALDGIFLVEEAEEMK